MPPPHESPNQTEINQNFLINQVASGLATTTELIQSLSSEIKDNTIELAIMKADLANVTKDVRTLSKILREGDGTAPVLSRIAVLESTSTQLSTSISTAEASFAESKEKLDSLSIKLAGFLDSKKTAAEDKKDRRKTILAIITSIIALISAIAVALLT
jgi:hypothetical protein